MSELNELMLKSLQENKNSAPEYFEYQHPRFGMLKFRGMNKAEKREFLMSRELPITKGKKITMSVGDTLNSAIKYIYNCFELAPYAEKAKEEGKIIKYYEILDYLFEPFELIDMMAELFEKSNFGGSDKDIEEDTETIKKQ